MKRFQTKFTLFSTLFILLILGLAGCQSAPEPEPTATAIPPTPIPTNTLAPTATSTPVPTATPTDLPPTEQNTPAVVAPSTPLPDEYVILGELPLGLPPIMAENVQAMRSLLTVENEGAFDVVFSPTADSFAQVFTDWIWVYRLDENHMFGSYLVQGQRPVFSPNGRYLATTTGDNNITLYDVYSGAEIGVMRQHTDFLTSYAFSRDSRWLASSALDGQLILWDASTASASAVINVTEILPDGPWVDMVYFGPNGELAAFSGEASTMMFTTLAELLAGSGKPRLVSWTDFAGPGSQAFLSPEWDALMWVARATLVFMNPVTTEIYGEFSHEDFLSDPLFAPDGQVFFRTSQAVGETFVGVFVVYDYRTGDRVNTLPHNDFPATAVLSPGGDTLAAADFSNVVRLWNVSDGQLRTEFATGEFGVSSLLYSSDGSLLMTLDNAATFHGYDARTGTELYVDTSESGNNLLFADWLKGDSLLATIDADGDVQLWGVAP